MKVPVSWLRDYVEIHLPIEEVAQFQSGVEAIDAELDELELLGRSIELGPIDWDVEPKLDNALLRALWEYVELGPDQRPVRAEWRLRAWRSTPEGPPAPGG